jgi:hypothetical protein
MFAIGEAIAGVSNLVGKFVESPDKANELEAQIKQKLLAIETEVVKAQRDVIVAEAKSTSWLTTSWRPLCMVTFVVIIANNYILFPYIQLFGGTAVELEIPSHLWDLLKLGIGGYIAGRSGEKIVESYAKNRS